MDIHVEMHLSYETDVWAYGMVTLENIIRFPVQLRKFKNKADIFFAGGEQYSQMLLTKMKESKANNPLAIVLESYFYAADFFDEHRERTVKRQKIIASHPDLEERELLKQSKIEELLVEYLLIAYGERSARLAVRLARAVYSVAWEEWLENDADSLHHLLEKSIADFNELKNY